MKKKLFILALATLLGACTATEKKTEKVAEAPKEVHLSKAAIMMPINNTNDQNTAEMLWEDFTAEEIEVNGDKVMAAAEVEKISKAAGYSYGDQLTQLDTPEKKVAFQEKFGADGLVYLTVEDIHSKLNPNPFSPTTERVVDGEAVVYVDGVEVATYDVAGTEVKKISKEVLQLSLEIGNQLVQDQDIEAALLAILALSNPEIRAQVADAVLAISGPTGTKLETLMYERGLIEESPYKGAVTAAVEKTHINF